MPQEELAVEWNKSYLSNLGKDKEHHENHDDEDGDVDHDDWKPHQTNSLVR